MHLNKILLITGDKLRHKYYAVRILQKFSDAEVIFEKQKVEPWGSHIEQPSSLMQQHFKKFAETENAFFSEIVNHNESLIEDRTFLEVEEGGVNSDRVISLIKQKNPFIIPTFSTSLLKRNFICNFPRKLINFHAGLSPYYRGSGTNVFPFLNKELEYVGITLHYIDEGIDSGEIILHGRPTFEENDNTHTIGCKNVILAADLMIRIIEESLQHRALPKGLPQELATGRLYYKKDFTDDVIHGIQENLRRGIIQEYLAHPPKKINIIEAPVYE